MAIYRQLPRWETTTFWQFIDWRQPQTEDFCSIISPDYLVLRELTHANLTDVPKKCACSSAMTIAVTRV
jgi:hypothetical protein